MQCSAAGPLTAGAACCLIPQVTLCCALPDARYKLVGPAAAAHAAPVCTAAPETHRAERHLRPRQQLRSGGARAILADGHARAHPRAGRQPHARQHARRLGHRGRARVKCGRARVVHLRPGSQSV
jgi:hypothetical protein